MSEPFAGVRIDGPTARAQELETGDADVGAAQQQDHARIDLFLAEAVGNGRMSGLPVASIWRWLERM